MDKKQLIPSVSRWLAITRIISIIFMVGAVLVYLFIDSYVGYLVKRDINRYLDETGLDVSRIGKTLPTGFEIISEIHLDNDLVDATFASIKNNIWIADSVGLIHLFDVEKMEIVKSIGEGQLTAPTGIYRSEESQLLVADDLNRILFMTETGEIERIIPLNAGEFQPFRVVEGSGHVLYILSQGNKGGIWTTTDNEQTQSQPTLLFSAPGQRDLYARGGYVYSTGSILDGRPLAKITSYGLNEFSFIDTKRMWALPHWDQDFIGIHVDNQLFITLLDETGNLFHLSDDGYALLQYRSTEPHFRAPVSLLSDEEGGFLVIYRDGVAHFQLSSVGRWVKEGKRLTSSGDHHGAIPLWNQVLQVDPYSFAARWHLAESLFQSNEYASAAKEYKLVGNKEGYQEAINQLAMEIRRGSLAAPTLAFIILWAVILGLSLIWRGVTALYGYENPYN